MILEKNMKKLSISHLIMLITVVSIAMLIADSFNLFRTKFKIGDCIALKNDIEINTYTPERWEPQPDYDVYKILEIGKRKYRAVMYYGKYMASSTYSIRFYTKIVKVLCTQILENYHEEIHNN